MIVKGLALFDIPWEKDEADQLTLYISELMRWNDRVNLVGFKDARRIVEVLLYDTLHLASHVRGGTKILDLGSGSGIMAVPLKILCPAIEVFSVDSSLRKIQFQRHIQRTLSLERFTPIHERAERLPPVGADTLIAKAFGSIPLILEMGRPHILPHGTAFVPKGARETPTQSPGWTLQSETPYTLPPAGHQYKLFVYKRTQD